MEDEEMRGKHIIVPLVLFILLVGTFNQFNVVEAEEQLTFLNLLDVTRLKDIETYTKFLYPRIGLPAFVSPFSIFNIVLYSPEFPDGVDRAYLYKGGLSVELEIVESMVIGKKLVLNVSLYNVTPGLYNLVVEKSGKKYVEYNSVMVKNKWDYPIKILRYSDTHYDTRISAIWQRENFLKLIWRANFLKPDFLIITGDILNTATEDNYKSFVKDLANILRVPLVLVPGNHDHHYKEDLFTIYAGASNVSINIGPLHLILVDTGPNGMAGWITNDQIRWIKEDLERFREWDVKMMASHHPFSLLEQSERSNMSGLEEVLRESDVDMILHGHMHYLMVEKDKYPFRLTDPNAYEGGKPYTGFRLIYINGPDEIEWQYRGTDNPYPMFNLTVYEYQLQNGSNYGYTLYVSNNMDIAIEGYVNARIKPSEDIIVSGIDEESLEIRSFPQFIEIIGKVIIESGEERTVKIYSKEDNQPPKISNINIDTMIGKRVSEYLYIELWDEVSGIESITIKYTLDNVTWEESTVYRLTPILFYTVVKHSKENGFALKIWATDVEGNEFYSGILNYSLIVEKEEVEKPEAPPLIDMSYIVYALVGLIILVAVLLYIKRK